MISTNPIEWEDLTFPERVAVKMKSEKSFLNFSRLWFEILQGETLLINWHHRWIARKLDAIIKSEGSVANKGNIIFNIPPGGTKTELISIHAPAYINMLCQTGKLNKFRNMNISFSESLVMRNSRRTRDIIASKEYQELWPCSFGVNKAEEWDVIDSKGKVKGQTISRSTGGQITGGRGGFSGPDFSGAVVQDDPDKPEDMFSPTKRESSHRRQTNTIRSRRGDKSKDNPTPFWLIQQRLHFEDVTAFLLRGGMGVEFDHVSIPALITEDYLASLPEDIREDCWSCIKDSDCREIEGVKYWSYWPEMEHIDQLIGLWEADEYTFWSQYMQNPIKQSGGLIDTAWFGEYTEIPSLQWVAIYVDTNSGKVNDRNDYTVFALCGKGHDGNMYILDMERGKWDPEELLTKAEELWSEWSQYPYNLHLTCRYMSIEDKQAGQGLITTLNRKNVIPVKDVQRGADQNKVIRHHNAQPHIKRGKVMVPMLHNEDGVKIESTNWFDGTKGFDTKWVMPFLSECSLLTYEVLLDKEDGYDDQYDTIMDAIQDMLIDDVADDFSVDFMLRR